MEKNLQEIENDIQEECHLIVNFIYKQSNPKTFNYQDATNVFLFRKLAELQLQINKLEKEK